MQDNEVGALAILCIFGLPILAFILFRCFQFIERIEMIKRGIIPPPQMYGGRRAWREWNRQQQQQPGPAPWANATWQQQAQTPPPPPPQPAAWYAARAESMHN